MNENQTNNTKDVRPRKSHGKTERSLKRKRVKPSRDAIAGVDRMGPILRVGYDLLDQLKVLMRKMLLRENPNEHTEEQVFTTSLAIIGWLNQQVTLRYALEVQNYRGDIMASHLLSTEEQQSRAIKQPRVQGVRNAETVYGGEKRPKVAREAFENQEVSKGVPVPEAPALSDEEVALMLHREMNVQPFLRRSSLGTKDKPADPVGASINEHLAMLVEKITGFKCDQNA